MNVFKMSGRPKLVVGVGGQSARTVWAGMQSASAATRAKVEYLSVTGSQTADNAAAYLASLVQRKCALIFTTGGGPTAGAQREASKYPTITFYVVGTGSGGHNLRYFDGAASTVANLVTNAVQATPR